MAVKVKQHRGNWWFFIDYKGKRKAKRVGSKKAAEMAARRIEAKLALGQFDIREEKENPVLFADSTQKWLSIYATIRCKPSSVREYEVVLSRYLTPTFGDKPLAITARLYTILRLLGSILTSAIEDGKIVANPQSSVCVSAYSSKALIVGR